MNARIVLAGLLISAATAPAFAAGDSATPADEGLPPNIAQNFKRAQAPVAGGEVTVSQSQRYMAPQDEGSPPGLRDAQPARTMNIAGN